jgi:hypothetical protein
MPCSWAGVTVMKKLPAPISSEKLNTSFCRSSKEPQRHIQEVPTPASRVQHFDRSDLIRKGSQFPPIFSMAAGALLARQFIRLDLQPLTFNLQLSHSLLSGAIKHGFHDQQDVILPV